MKGRIRVGLPLEEVTAEDRREWLSQQREAIEQRAELPPESRQGMRDRIEGTTFAATKPVWQDPFIDDAGYFWFMVPWGIPMVVNEIPQIGYYLLSPEGEYLERTQPPLIPVKQTEATEEGRKPRWGLRPSNIGPIRSRPFSGYAAG